MKKNIVKFLLITFIFFVGIKNIGADLTNYNGGSSQSLGGLGSGDWCDTCVGLKISIVSSNGTVEDSEIILNNTNFSTPAYFSTDMNPKFKQNDDSISWVSTADVTYYKSSFIPDDWNPSEKIINFDSKLSDNDYALLKSLLDYKNSSGNKIFTNLSSGDYIVIEPMTKIGKYYGTAFELFLDFNDTKDDANRTWPSNGFTVSYSKSVFGGASSNPGGGIFYNTIYLDQAILGMTVYSDPAKLKYDARNDCFKSKTCGRGIGVYRYDDIVPPEPEPEPEKYTLDLNVIVDGTPVWELRKDSVYLNFDFSVNNIYTTNTNHYKSLYSGSSYEISNITSKEGYTYLGYNTSYSVYGIEPISINTSISGTLTSDVQINFIIESTCQKKLENIIANGKSLSELFNLYRDELAKGNNYRNLLNVTTPSCTTKVEPSKEINNLTCLSGSTLSHNNFNEANLTDYDEIITDIYGNYIGFCLTSMDLKNNLYAQKFYSKSGQFLVKEVTGKNEIELYNSEYLRSRVCGDTVATATVTKVCYMIKGKTSAKSDFEKTDKTVSVYFGDNNIDGNADELNLKRLNTHTSTQNQTSNVNLLMHNYEKKFEFGLNEVWLGRITGKAFTSKTIGSSSLKGIISKFNSTSGTIPFTISYEGKNYGTDKSLCTYETIPEVISKNKLNMEFRIIDTNNPFNRITNSNWSNGTDNSSNNAVVKQYINEATNSYGIKEGQSQTPIYKITLTSSDIKAIREYNKEVSYDNYKVDCKTEEDGTQVCKNAFLANLENGYLIMYDTDAQEQINKTLYMSNRLIKKEDSSDESNDSLNQSNIETEECMCINYNSMCRPVTSNTVTTGNIPKGNFVAGDEYICEVKSGTEYHFFVLNTENDKVNLIMDRNIYYDSTNDVGKVATSTNPEGVEWHAGAIDHSSGPVTAMTYLHNATKDWNKVPNMIMNYEDDSTQKKGTNGYGGIKTTGNITVITSKNNRETGRIENLKARMPRYDEVHGVNKCLTYAENGNKYGSCPLWLSNYLDSSSYVTGEGLQNISGIYGYWTLSSGDYSTNAWHVSDDGYVSGILVNIGFDFGVRPVITVYKSQIE